VIILTKPTTLCYVQAVLCAIFYYTIAENCFRVRYNTCETLAHTRIGKLKRFTIEKTQSVPLVVAVIVRMLILYRRYDRPLEETVKCQHPKPWTRSTASAVNNTCTSLFYFSLHRPPTSTHTTTPSPNTTTTVAAPPLLPPHCNSPSPIYTS